LSESGERASKLVITDADLGVTASRSTRPPVVSARPFRRRRPLVTGAIATVVTLLFLGLLTELLLPPLAEKRLRGHLSANATGVTVHVTARPAVKLLFGRADTVDVHIREMRSGRGDLGDSLASTARTGRLDVTVSTLVSHGLRIEDVTLRKRGTLLTASATVTRAAVDAVLPRSVHVEQSHGGRNTLVFTGTVRAFGRVARGTVLVRARGGRLVLEPDSVVGRIAPVRLFADPRVQIDSIRSRRFGNRYVFTARGHLT
jgi:hypothetical protein